jgi:cell division protein FtsB
MAARKKRAPVISLTQFVAIVTATLALTLLLGFAYKMNTYAQIKLEAENLQRRLERVRAEHETLNDRKVFVQSNEYVEKIAREELKWSRRGDQMVSVHTLPAPTPVPAPTLQAGSVAEPSVPQWQAWQEVFFSNTRPIYGF